MIRSIRQAYLWWNIINNLQFSICQTLCLLFAARLLWQRSCQRKLAEDCLLNICANIKTRDSHAVCCYLNHNICGLPMSGTITYLFPMFNYLGIPFFLFVRRAQGRFRFPLHYGLMLRVRFIKKYALAFASYSASVHLPVSATGGGRFRSGLRAP